MIATWLLPVSDGAGLNRKLYKYGEGINDKVSNISNFNYKISSRRPCVIAIIFPLSFCVYLFLISDDSTSFLDVNGRDKLASVGNLHQSRLTGILEVSHLRK